MPKLAKHYLPRVATLKPLSTGDCVLIMCITNMSFSPPITIRLFEHPSASAASGQMEEDPDLAAAIAGRTFFSAQLLTALQADS
jgi:hypothetical protein